MSRRIVLPAPALAAAGLLVVVAVIAARVALAERPHLPKEKLAAEASHTVVGKVLGVYKREVVEGRAHKTRFLVEIEIESVEQGEGLTKGEMLYARAWRMKRYIGQMPPGPSGHSPVPKAGQRVRAHVVHGPYAATAQKDQGFAVVYPNGIEVLD